MSDKDRRISPRVEGDFNVELNCGDGGIVAAGCDLAVQGISCSLPDSVNITAPVELNLILPSRQEEGEQAIHCRGIPLRQEPPGAGDGNHKVVFKLEEVKEGDIVELEDYVASRTELNQVPKDISMRITDLEPNGFSAQSNFYLPLFHEIKTKFSFASGEKGLECSALVVKCDRDRAEDPFEVVMFFTDMEPEARTRLSRYLFDQAAE